MLGFTLNLVLRVSLVFGQRVERVYLSQQHSRKAVVEEAPYVVALVKEVSNATYLPFCTGSIITHEWVLSAAHCIYNISSVKFWVVAGCDSVKQMDLTLNDSSRQVSEPLASYIHPYFMNREKILPSQKFGLFDVCLIQVETSFKFGLKVNLIPLWATKWNGTKVIDGGALERECRSFGWGDKGPNLPTERLMVSTFMVRHGTGGCSACLDYGPTSRLICTAELNGHSVCTGDSGGPLVCEGVLVGTTHMMGKCITSPGFRRIETPKNGCGTDGVFSTWMYVCPMLEWIHEIVEETPEMPESCRASPPVAALNLFFPAFLVHFHDRT